jgi:hypothetical protein
MDTTLEFRDGKRVVPEHVYAILRTQETYRWTYEEALNFANSRMFRDHVNAAHDKFIIRHFKEHS